MHNKTISSQALTSDRVMAAALVLGALAAIAIAQEFGQMGVALVGAGLISAIGLAVWRLSPGSLLSRLTFASTLTAMVALHIDLGRGTIEFHFGVFVVLGILLMYSDWRPILLAAALVAVEHLVTDRMQAFGMNVFCTTSPSVLKVVMHAVYVILQTGAEIYMAVWMTRAATQGAASAASLTDTLGRLRAALATTQESAAQIESAILRNRERQRRPEPAHGAVGQPAPARGELDGTTDVDGQEQRRIGRGRQSPRRLGRQGGRARRRRRARSRLEDGGHHHLQPQDRRHHRRHRRHRLPDQHPRAQRGGRGRAGGRAGTWIRGGRHRGPVAGPAQRDRRARDQEPDQRECRERGFRVAARQRGGHDDAGGRRRHPQRGQHHRRDLALGNGADCRDRADPRYGGGPGPDDAAELGAGRTERRPRRRACASRPAA